MKIIEIVKLLLIASILFGITSCKDEPVIRKGIVKYSELVMRESPYPGYAGAIELTEEQAKKRLHFEFTYDDQGRVVQVVNKLGDKMYREDGRSHNGILPTAKVTLTYEKDKIIVHYFNNFNEPVSVRGNVFSSVFHLDENGNKKSLGFLNREGEPVENNEGISSYSWSVNEKGHVVEKRVNFKGELMPLRPYFLFYETHFEFDEKGLVHKMYNYGKEGKLENNPSGVAMDLITYNEHGIFSSWSVFDKDMNPTRGNRPLIHKGVHISDEYGRITSTEYYDINDELMLNYRQYAVEGFVRSDRGQLMEYKIYNTARNLIDGNQYYPATMKYKRNERGLITEQAYFDANEKRRLLSPQDPHAIQRMKYDENFNVAEQSVFGVDGNPINLPAEKGGGHRAVFSYKGSQRVKAVIFDKDGKQIAVMGDD